LGVLIDHGLAPFDAIAAVVLIAPFLCCLPLRFLILDHALEGLAAYAHSLIRPSPKKPGQIKTIFAAIEEHRRAYVDQGDGRTAPPHIC
jgi:hypothetical protein